MVENSKRPKIVGNFIRDRREARGLSQRALGLLFTPPVTTQFISNMERGVTPLPPAHVPTLARALAVNETEILGLLEREYTLKLSGRLGVTTSAPVSNGEPRTGTSLAVFDVDLPFIRNLYEAYRQADPKTRQAFATVCESILNIPKSGNGSST